MDEIDDYLSSIYYDIKHQASYGSVQNLFKYARQKFPDISFKTVSHWLKKQLSYTLHKPARKNFLRNRIYVSYRDQQWQCDIVDMQQFSKENKGFKYLLTIIDCFSKYLWVVPLKTKDSTNIVEAFKIIFQERKPIRIQTDRGKEFDNFQFKSLCKKENIRFFTTQDVKIKCSIIERVNRTLKEWMFRYFTAKGTRNYINIIKDLVRSYNYRWHRSIKMRPVDVNESNEKLVFKNLYGLNNLNEIYAKRNVKKNYIKIGSIVRKKYDLSKLDRGYYPNWSDQTFKVNKRIDKIGKNQYIIEDFRGDSSKRRFYQEELQEIGNRPAYRVEKILKRKKIGSILHYYVKWTNYPASENSWIPAKNLFNLQGKK